MSTTFTEGSLLIDKTATSSTGVQDNDRISRLGTCPTKISNPAELTLVLLRFRYLKSAPIHATCSTKSSLIVLELRSKCFSAFIKGKKQNLWREELDTSKKDRKLVSQYSKASASFMNVAPEKISFVKGALTPSPSSIVLMVQLLMFRHSRDDKFGNSVMLVQAILRELSLENFWRTAAPLLDTLLPQRSRYCSFVST